MTIWCTTTLKNYTLNTYNNIIRHNIISLYYKRLNWIKYFTKNPINRLALWRGVGGLNLPRKEVISKFRPGQARRLLLGLIWSLILMVYNTARPQESLVRTSGFWFIKYDFTRLKSAYLLHNFWKKLFCSQKPHYREDRVKGNHARLEY